MSSNESANGSPEPVNQRSVRRSRLVILRVLAIAMGILIGMVAAEAGLRVVERIRLGDRVTPAFVSDPLLGARMVPNTAGHDAKGFRNPSVPAQVNVVALGDSQTWGVNAQSQDTWPRQLEKISRQTVYNMGVGGYGPVQYWVLADEALTFAPKDVVVGLYFGNDLYDAYAFAYSNETYAQLRSKAISDQIRVDTIKSASERYWDNEKNFHNNYGRGSISGLDFWLREHSAIGRLLNRAGLWPGATDVDYQIDKAWAISYPDHGAFFEDADLRTVFTTAYRLTALDFDDPRVGEGLRITKEVLSRMQQKLDGHGARMTVLLIPTKETVYADLMRDQGRLTGNYARLVGMESRARNEIESWCAEKQMKCVDALPDMRSAISRRQRVYPSTTESHPSAAGYGILSATISKALQK